MHKKKTCATRSIFDRYIYIFFLRVIFDRYDQESRKQKDEDFDCEKNSNKLVKPFL